MIKELFSGIFALALLTTAGWGVSQNLKSDANLNELALANVEALAQNEDNDDMIALCEWYAGQYCHYYVAYPGGSGTGWSHWNMKNR